MKFFIPHALLNKVMTEWVQCLAGSAVFPCHDLQGCKIIVSSHLFR